MLLLGVPSAHAAPLAASVAEPLVTAPALLREGLSVWTAKLQNTLAPCRHTRIHRAKYGLRLQSTHLSRRRWSLRYSSNWF